MGENESESLSEESPALHQLAHLVAELKITFTIKKYKKTSSIGKHWSQKVEKEMF